MSKSNKPTAKPNGSISPIIPTDVQVIEHGRDIHMYRITDTELDAMVTGYHSLNLTFFSICIGALIVLITTLSTVALSDRIFALFIALMCLSGILGFYFGVRTFIERRKLTQGVATIKDSRKIPN